METADLLIEARWIIPIEPENTVLDDHAIVVRNKKIEDILPQPEGRSKYDAKRTIRLDSHHVLLPGFVNTHTHSAMSLLRGIADDLPLMDWLKEHVWPVEGKWVSENFVRDGTELAVLEMLRGGTTCFNDMYFYPGEAGRVADAAGLRCTLGMVAIGTDGAASNNDLDMIQELRSAALLAKGISGDPTAVPAYRALEMATLGGARAIAREHEIGSLAPGKAADIIAVDLGATETRPVYNPISQVAYAASRKQVSHVWVEGKALLEEGEPSTLDEQAILEKADRWQRKIASS
eukprot:XP_011408019.1 PREDICTED: uncharacterized protein LOC100641527 [Amphimedon queenslandica]